MLYFLNIIAFIFFPFRISSNKRCVTVNSVKNSTSMYTSYYIKKKINFFRIIHIHCIQGNIRPPPFFSPLSPWLSEGEFQCLELSLFKPNYVWTNSRRAKPFASKEIKNNRGENNPVYITVILVSNVSASHCQHVSCNGGHCLSKDQSYICICPVGYDGRNCQHKGELFDS